METFLFLSSMKEIEIMWVLAISIYIYKMCKDGREKAVWTVA